MFQSWKSNQHGNSSNKGSWLLRLSAGRNLIVAHADHMVRQEVREEQKGTAFILQAPLLSAHHGLTRTPESCNWSLWPTALLPSPTSCRSPTAPHHPPGGPGFDSQTTGAHIQATFKPEHRALQRKASFNMEDQKKSENENTQKTHRQEVRKQAGVVTSSWLLVAKFELESGYF